MSLTIVLCSIVYNNSTGLIVYNNSTVIEFTHSVLVLRLSWKWIDKGVKKVQYFQILHLVVRWD